MPFRHRKETHKLNTITYKGAVNLTIKDVIKTSRKGNSIQNTIKKGAKEFNVCFFFSTLLWIEFLKADEMDFYAISPSEAELEQVIEKMDRLVGEQDK